MFSVQCEVRIKNQPSNSTSCSGNALRLLVLVAGRLHRGLQVMSTFSIWGCIFKGCFERGMFWRAKPHLKRIEDFHLKDCSQGVFHHSQGIFIDTQYIGNSLRKRQSQTEFYRSLFMFWLLEARGVRNYSCHRDGDWLVVNQRSERRCFFWFFNGSYSHHLWSRID